MPWMSGARALPDHPRLTLTEGEVMREVIDERRLEVHARDLAESEAHHLGEHLTVHPTIVCRGRLCLEVLIDEVEV